MGRPFWQEPLQRKFRWMMVHLLVVQCCHCLHRPIGEIVVRRVAFRREVDAIGPPGGPCTRADPPRNDTMKLCDTGRPALQEPLQQKSRWTRGHLIVVHCCRCPHRPFVEIVVRRVAFRREIGNVGQACGTAYAGLGHSVLDCCAGPGIGSMAPWSSSLSVGCSLGQPHDFIMAALRVMGHQCHQDGELGDVLVRLLQENHGNRTPVKVLFCDMNIWWRVAKVVYNREHAASPVRGALP